MTDTQAGTSGKKSKDASPAKAKAPEKPAKIELITLRDISMELAESRGLTQKQANEFLSETVSLIVQHLKKGARIRIAGLGTLEVRERPARMGRNPSTGVPIQIEASTNVAFRAAKDLKEAM